MFTLHSQLARDTRQLGERSGIIWLLHRNAALPWFILVPTGGAWRDPDELPGAVAAKLAGQCRDLSQLLRTEFAAQKINIAALGNQVPQLHVHVIGRREDDPCWPNPVWGNLPDGGTWSDQRLAEIRQLAGF